MNNQEPYKFIEVKKEISEPDLERVHGNILNVFGYTPCFFVMGTQTVFINGRPLLPGMEWCEPVPHTAPLQKKYHIVFGNDYSETPSVNGYVLRPGKWLEVSWKEKVPNY